MTVKRNASDRRSIELEVEVPGTPEDVWQTVLFLSSEEAAHINGEAVDVNGGFWTD